MVFLDQPLEGMCDRPDSYHKLWMYLPEGNSLNDLATAIHEAAHAEGIPDKYLDKDRDFTIHIAKFLWRLGWRKKKKTR